MRVFYLDPGLHDSVGHHVNYCVNIAGELRRRGIETLVFAHEDLPPVLQSECGAVPHFRVFTYTNNDDDPFCPWLTGFRTLSRRTREDLAKLPEVGPSDLVFATSVRPVQVAAILDWRRDLIARGAAPTIVLESVNTGLSLGRSPQGTRVSVPDPRIDPRSVLFRYVAEDLPRERGSRFHVVTFAPNSTRLFGLLLDYPVETLPLPYGAIAPLRNRTGARPIQISILGHQKLAKGYETLPDIVRELLRVRSNIRLLVQSIVPSESLETQQALRDIAASTDRLVLEETPANGRRWAQLMNMSDIVLCPHRLDFYTAFSSVLAEALANGIPAVVPAESPLDALLRECGGPGERFKEFDPVSIATATSVVIDRFDHFASLAHAAALRWPGRHGPARLVDALLSLAGARS